MTKTSTSPSPAAAAAPGPAPARKRSNIEVIFTVMDEEVNLPHSLPTVAGWADRVWVVDSGSSDRTLEIARAHGAEVVFQKWLGYAGQKNWCLDNLPIESDWVLIVDGDEAVMPDLRDAMLKVASRPVGQTPEAAFYVNRYFIFLNKRIKHCGYYPSWNIRFLKKGRARYEMRDVHEHMIADGAVGYLDGNLEHNDRRGLQVYMEKHNKYSTLEAREILRYETGESKESFKGKLLGNAAQRRRWIKRNIYGKLPLKSFWRFTYCYIVRLGFLDGLTGLRFCLFLAAYEHLIEIKLVEMRQEIRERRERGGNP